ncbi:MAG: hypothetical protein ACP5Q4_08285 [Candidatus Caldatribacteriaceae bacterium]
MRVRWISCLCLAVFALVLVAGCSGGPSTPTPTPTTAPTTTAKPSITIATAGTKTLQSGDAIQPGTIVHFIGQGPASAQIRVYEGATLVGAAVADPSGSFGYNWTAGTTEGNVELRFTAKQPDLAESEATTFVLEIDGTKPYIVSGSAKADALLGAPPVITVVFNEPLVINDMNIFTLVPSPFFTITTFGGSVFNLTQITLGADQKTVTLTGQWNTDQLIAGTNVAVAFNPGGPLTVTDQAGNPCMVPTGTIIAVTP